MNVKEIREKLSERLRELDEEKRIVSRMLTPDGALTAATANAMSRKSLWTPERRAEQSKRLKAMYRRKRREKE